MSSPAWISTWRDRAVVALAAAVFIVPATILLAGPKPSRLGFQMYSGYGMVSATWTDQTGQRHDVHLGRHVANPRTEVDWPAILPERLCKRIADAVRVEVQRTQPGGTEVRSLGC